MLKLLQDPHSREALTLQVREQNGDEILEGELLCDSSGEKYPIIRGIPRFVSAENYAENFGFEWNLFAELQTDRLQNHNLTHERFFEEIGIKPEDLAGKRVLEAGCGGGRFSDVVLEAGAEVYAFDLSNAVDKNQEIHKGNRNLNLVQASIDGVPFAHGAFDLVFCFGVLQHTPNPAGFFQELVPFVKPGGTLTVDVYAAHPKQLLHWKYALRPVTKRMKDEQLLRLVERAAHAFVPISRQVRRIPRIGKALSRLIPIFVHDGFMGKVPKADEERWAILETFDALSPAYDRPRSRRAVQRWFERAGFTDIETFNLNNALNYGRGRCPSNVGS